MKIESKICEYCGGEITRLIPHLSCKVSHNINKKNDLDTKDIIFNKLEFMKEHEYVVYIAKEDNTSVPITLFRGEDITDFEIQTGMFQPGYIITIERQLKQLYPQ